MPLTLLSFDRLRIGQVADELREGRLSVAGGSDWALDMQIRLYRRPGEMTASAEALWSLVRASAT